MKMSKENYLKSYLQHKKLLNDFFAEQVEFSILMLKIGTLEYLLNSTLSSYFIPGHMTWLVVLE